MATTVTPPRFLPWALVFALTRAGDLWSTSLFMLQPGGEAGEMNPLTSVLGLSYWPLTVANILFSALLLYGHWHYCTHFGQRTLPGVPSGRSDYVSLLFFGRPGQAWKAFYTVELNKGLHYSQLAHVLVMTFACVSVLAVIHNLGQVYGWRFNDLAREFLVRPSLVYYGMCLPLVVFFALRMMEREFRIWQQQRSHADRLMQATP